MADLKDIHALLGGRDARILQMVLGEGYSPATAIREVCADYKFTIAARFREALDALCDAQGKVRIGRRAA